MDTETQKDGTPAGALAEKEKWKEVDSISVERYKGLISGVEMKRSGQTREGKLSVVEGVLQVGEEVTLNLEPEIDNPNHIFFIYNVRLTKIMERGGSYILYTVDLRNETERAFILPSA